MLPIDGLTRPGTTLANQLAAAIRRAIDKGDLLPEQAIPSEREICEEHSVSRSTVRRAISMLVEEGILYTVPGSGTYVRGGSAAHATLATLGLVVPTLANPYFGELSDAIEHEAHQRGYQLLVGQSDYTRTDEAAHLTRYADNFSVKGVIAVPNVEEAARAAYRYLNEQTKPFVFTARWPEDIPADSVATDGFYGARQMVTYLLQLGHRRIAYVEGYPHQPDVRLRGYKQGLSDAGVPLNESLIVLLDQPADEAGLTATRQLLRQRIDFSAIFARNDLTAVGVLRGLSEAGLKVPADVSVVGFDSTKLSAHLQPPLTTVDHTLHEIGRQAVLLLLDRIEGRYTGPARRITIEPRLVVRESCRALT